MAANSSACPDHHPLLRYTQISSFKPPPEAMNFWHPQTSSQAISSTTISILADN